MDFQIDVPESLAELTVEELGSLRDALRTAILSIPETPSSDDLEWAELFDAEFDRISSELSAREAAANKAAALRGKYAPVEAVELDAEPEADVVVEAEELTATADAEIVDDAPQIEEPVVELAATEEPVVEEVEELAVEAVEAVESEPIVELTSDEVIPEPTAAEVVELAVETQEEPEIVATLEVVELTTEATEETKPEIDVKEPELATAATNEGAASLQSHRPEFAAPKETKVGTGIIATSWVNGAGIDQGQEFTSMTKFADALLAKKSQFGRGTEGDRAHIPVGQFRVDHTTELTMVGDAQANWNVLRTAGETADALVASGGICAPFSPSYNIFRLAEVQSPVESCLPVVGAPRGGIRYIVPPSLQDARAAIGTVTCQEDAAGYASDLSCPPNGPTPLKPCTCVECPAIAECCVTAVSTCVRFGNLNYRTFPEQVEAFMEDVAVMFASEKEVLYLDAIAANSTAVTGFNTTYGAVRNFIYNIALAAVGYRKRNWMRPDRRLQVFIPNWVPDVIKLDMLNNFDEGLSYARMTTADVESMLSAYNLDVCWYNDSATGAGQAFTTPQAAGPINTWPTQAHVYIYSPGSFVRLDGGTLDLGVVRDSTLNRSNDLELFMEQWTGVCFIGIESIDLLVDVCPNGAAPLGVPAFAC